MIPCLAVPCDGVRWRPRAREGGGGLRASFLSPWCLLCEHCESGIKYLPHWVLLKKVNDFGQLYYLPQTLHCPIAVLSETCALASRPELLRTRPDGTNAAMLHRSTVTGNKCRDAARTPDQVPVPSRLSADTMGTRVQHARIAFSPSHRRARRCRSQARSEN